MPYEVQTPVFAGPFDLLLHLILREQVDIYEVSITTVVDAYLHEIDRMETFDLDVATEFLLIAATLIELKSRRLLPSAGDGELDEELALWEERDVLLARLLECKTFKDAARALDRLSDAAARSQPRPGGLEEQFLDVAPDLLEGVTPAALRAAARRALAPKPAPKVDLDHVAPIRVSVRDAVEQLLVELPRQPRTTFRKLTAGVEQRLEIIVRFLAILELYKQGLVELAQAGTFAEISVTWTGGDAEPTHAAMLADAEGYDR
jgi:segregation and condensation protein A